MSYNLLNQPEDIVEGLISVILFIILYVVYRVLTESDETLNSIKSMSIIQVLILIIIMGGLYIGWYFGTKIIRNYIYLNMLATK